MLLIDHTRCDKASRSEVYKMDTSISQLKNMFPAIDEESIRSVLNHCLNNVDTAIETLLTFSEDDKQKDLSPPLPQGIIQAVQEEISTKKGCHPTAWPHFNDPKQDIPNEAPVISRSPQWVYPYPYSFTGPPSSVAMGYNSHVIPNGGRNGVSAPVQPTVKRHWPQPLVHSSQGCQASPSSIAGKRLIIMRGLPGSGKSTMAKKLKGQAGAICSTDDYFMVDGVYRFDGFKIGEYHERNQKRATELMRCGVSPVIVDNTNTRCHEMRPYVAAALRFKYEVEFREPDTPWKFDVSTLFRKNIHGLSRAVLERMLERYEHRVTTDAVMGSNKSASRSVHQNRDALSAPTGNSKADDFLIMRSPPVTTPAMHRTSPHCKMKNYSHGYQATGRGWHDNQPKLKAALRSDRDMFWRPSQVQSTTSNQTTPQSTTVNSSSYHTGSNNTKLSGLSVDTGSHCSQSTSSPCSEAAQYSNEGNGSCPVSDIACSRSHHSNYHIQHSYSDSVIPAVTSYYNQNVQFSVEPLQLVPQHFVPATPLPEIMTSLTNQDSSTSRSWSSSELFHDSDDVNDQTDDDNDQTDDDNDQTDDDNDQTDDDNDQTDDDNDQTDDDNDQSGYVDSKKSTVENSDEVNSYDNYSSTVTSDLNDTESFTELADMEDDINFLKSCVVGVADDQVLAVYNDCNHNVELAIYKLLQWPTSPVDSLPDFNNVVKMEDDEGRKTFQEDLTVANSNKVMTAENSQELVDDETMARALQEELDREIMEEKLRGLPSNKELQAQPCPASSSTSSVAIAEDEGLILRLAPPLASKLQDMFGNVNELLINEGEPSGDDLVVLLSERAAKEIHKKWRDTLQAKKIEASFNNAVQLQKDEQFAQQLQRQEHLKDGTALVRGVPTVVGNGGRKWKKKHPKKHKQQPVNLQAKSNSPAPYSLSATPPAPSCLKDIIHEQGVAEQESQQVSEIVLDACKNSAVTNIKVKELYQTFPSLNQHYIDQLLLEHTFDFDRITSELQRRQARKPLSVMANPPAVVHHAKPLKMSPRKDETSTAPGNGPGPASKSEVQELWTNPSYEDIRAEAGLHAQMRVESFRKAAEAYSRKRGELAVYYAQQGHLHTSKMNDANERAAEMILSKSASNSDILDLHGLFVKEALEALERKLATTTRRTICVVTGKGSHSDRGVARIKPAVQRYLDKNRYRYENVNEGQVKIFIDT